MQKAADPKNASKHGVYAGYAVLVLQNIKWDKNHRQVNVHYHMYIKCARVHTLYEHGHI